MVVGTRGEKRIVKGVVRERGAATRGPLRGAPAARGHGAPTLLPPRLRQGPWDPATRGRGTATRGRPRLNSKRPREDRQEQDEAEEEEEEMEDDRQPPPQPQPAERN
jgi:hypothetical protein